MKRIINNQYFIKYRKYVHRYMNRKTFFCLTIIIDNVVKIN